MEFRAVKRQELDAAAWQALVNGASFFQTSQWADICVDGLSPYARSVFLCGYERGRLAAGMPAIIVTRYGLKSLYSMPNDTYGGPVFSEDCDSATRETFLERMAEFFRRRRFSRTVITDFSGSLSEWGQPRLARARHFTHILVLGNIDEYRPHKKIAYDLRAGEKTDAAIIEIETVRHVAEFYRLYRTTEARHGRRRPRYTRRFFDAILTRLAGSEMLYWTGLMAGEELIGSQIHFIYGDTLFNWQTVSEYEKREYKPSQILMNDAVQYAAAKGLHAVNLGASPPDAAGLIRYKERWGGKRVEFDILTMRSGLRRLVGR
jgi:hypothetical protein